jgi:hypothetical protein
LRDHIVHAVTTKANIKIVHNKVAAPELVSGGYDTIVVATARDHGSSHG